MQQTPDGSHCDPFTITDAPSRYLIRCQSVSRMDLSQVRAIYEAAMREYGMPSKVYFWEVEIGEFDAEAIRFRPAQLMR